MKAVIGRFAKWLQDEKPLIGMIITQLVYAGMSILSKAAISSGMKPPIFVAYRQAIATVVLVPFAFFVERKTCPPLTWYMFGKLFIVSSVGIALSLNLYYAALNYVSATFATASTNTIPAMVFIVAVIMRIEKLAISKWYGRAKVLGTIVGISGAMAFTFYKGPPLHSAASINQFETARSYARTYTREEWIIGSFLLIGANLTWSIWLIMQSPILKEYSAKLRATTIQCACSCLTTTIYGAAVHRNISSWKLGWDVHLLSVAYSGILVTGITFTIQVWVVQKKGPVYTSIFSPLALVVTAVFSALFLGETLHWGSALGAGLLVIGLYCFLWGKNRETQILDQQKLGSSNTEAHLESIITSKSPTHEDKQRKSNSHDVKLSKERKNDFFEKDDGDSSD